MTDELKPCPFCGGKAMYYWCAGPIGINGKPEVQHCILCVGCKATSLWSVDKQKAVAAWNRRVCDD